MSFFSDLKRTTKATVGAVSKGVELLTFAAEEMDKGAEILVLKAECYRLETKLRRLKNHKSSAFEVSDVRRQLIEAYHRAIPEVNDIDRQSIASKLEAILVEEDKDEIRSVLDRVKSKEFSLECVANWTPISKIRALESLKSDYLLIAKLAGKLADKALVIESKERISDIADEIVELEKLRYEEVTEKYASGRQKSVIRRRDGLLHGKTEYWYDSGEPWKIICYKNGQPEGTCNLFRKDGSVLIEINVNLLTSTIVQKVYLSGGEQVLDGQLVEGSGEIRFWLWNGVSVGCAKYHEGKLQKVPLYLGLMIRPRVWWSIFQAAKNEKVKARFDETYEAMNLNSEFFKVITNQESVYSVGEVK